MILLAVNELSESIASPFFCSVQLMMGLVLHAELWHYPYE